MKGQNGWLLISVLVFLGLVSSSMMIVWDTNALQNRMNRNVRSAYQGRLVAQAGLRIASEAIKQGDTRCVLAQSMSV